MDPASVSPITFALCQVSPLLRTLDHCRTLYLPITSSTSCCQIRFPKLNSRSALAHSPQQVYHRKQGLSVNVCQMSETFAHAALASLSLQNSPGCQSGSSSSGSLTLADLVHEHPPHGSTMNHYLLHSLGVLFLVPRTPFPELPPGHPANNTLSKLNEWTSDSSQMLAITLFLVSLSPGLSIHLEASDEGRYL